VGECFFWYRLTRVVTDNGVFSVPCVIHEKTYCRWNSYDLNHHLRQYDVADKAACLGHIKYLSPRASCSRLPESWTFCSLMSVLGHDVSLHRSSQLSALLVKDELLVYQPGSLFHCSSHHSDQDSNYR